MDYHVIIKTERRRADEKVSPEVAARRANVPVTTVPTPDGEQLHTMAKEVTDLSNILYAAAWDGRSPWVEVLAGDIGNKGNHSYMGWPEETKAMHDERVAAESAKGEP